MHLADAFIQSNLVFRQYVYSLGIEPTTFCTANATLYHWATGTPVSFKHARHVYVTVLEDLHNNKCLRKEKSRNLL